MVVQDEEEELPVPLRGDILEAVLALAPLTDLVPASRVSKPWRCLVASSPSLFNRLEPWLLLHSYTTATHAYDSHSRTWIETDLKPHIDIEGGFSTTTAAVRSSNPNLLYALSPARLSFSFDPLHLAWHHAHGPTVWRADPVVALVGRRIVVAGGGCDFEDDPLAVEAYDLDSCVWTPRESMPASLKDSAASTWLSTAVCMKNRRLFVTEKNSGVTHTFDPEANVWLGPYDLLPDSSIFSVAITCLDDDRLVLVGLYGEAENVEGVRVWGVNCEQSNKHMHELMGEMPLVLVEKLRSESYCVASVKVCLVGNVLYIYNPGMVGEIFTCEFVKNGGGCRWGSVKSPRSWMERVVVTGSEVGIREVQQVLAAERRRFTAEFTGGVSG